jgi:indolepyruvate ferredoxin oxidoreductase beta subunit
VPGRELPARPVLALAPGIGDVDIVLASELLEAGRAIAGGFVTPDRTLMIASTSRSYLVVEKMAMGDGRYDSARVVKAVKDHAQAHLLVDMAALAKESGAMINAVMLAIMAGCGRLPIPAAAFEAAIRADGKAVETNLRGFRSGLAAAHGGRQESAARAEGATPSRRDRIAAASLADLAREIVAAMPAAARDVILEGTRRLAAYQDIAYARLYIDRLGPICAADERARAGGRLLRETARHLAVRMSYEDVIRVAQAKIDPARFARIAAETGVQAGEPFTVTEFLKPGVEELCSILPPAIATRILAAAERRGLIDRLHWGMEIDSTSISGFLRFWALAKLPAGAPSPTASGRSSARSKAGSASWSRRRDFRRSRARSRGMRAADQGYGDTLKRGIGNYRLIEARVIRRSWPGASAARGLDAIASAGGGARRSEGEALTRCLAELEEHNALRIAAE